MTDEALYVPDGDGFVGTGLTQGSWDPRHQHGGVAQALMVRHVLGVPTLTPMQIVRMTFDMIRPIPVGVRLDIDARVVREGKRIQLVEALLTTPDVEHVRATILRLRIEDVRSQVDTPASTALPSPFELPLPDSLRRMPERTPMPGFFRGLEVRPFARPGGPKGTTAFWMRPAVPLVAGEPTDPMARLAMAGDFTNTIGSTIDRSKTSTINPDTTVQVLRPPTGEWLAIVGDTRFQLDRGLGASVGVVSDFDGFVAATSTSQLLQPL